MTPEGAKIDNLCHVAHNVVIGRGVLIAAFGGISGSTIVGDGVTMGGRVGVADHRKIGAGATLAGGAAVFQDVPAGEVWSGYPARPLRKWLRESAWLSRKAAPSASPTTWAPALNSPSTAPLPNETRRNGS